MSAQPSIFESKSTYYNLSSKKWISGTFTLNDTQLKFQPDNNEVENLRLPLSTICTLEKRQSNFIYASLVVTVGAEKHWFASFQNRDTVYNLLELFWRQSLITVSSKRSPPGPKKANSALGKELLGILHESECTLVNAANALSEQGRQLQESQAVLEDIDSDLTVSQRLLQKMNLRFQTAFTGLIGLKSKIEEKTTGEESRQKHFKVTFTFTRSTDSCNWEQGTLIIADELSLLDEHKNKKLTVNYVEVEKLEIFSPWEFCITYSSSWVSKECYFMCAQLSSLLKFLNTFASLKKKIVLNDAEDIPSLNRASCSGASTSVNSPSSPAPIISLDQTPDSPDSRTEEAQALTEESAISDEDMFEISNALNNLQTLATEVNREQQNQMEKINTLLADAGKTELRITEQNKMIKKSM